MPINILEPPTVVGPGIVLTVQSDFIGPVPPDTRWDFVIVTTPGEDVVAHYSAPCTTPAFESAYWSIDNYREIGAKQAIPDGQQVAIQMQVLTPTGAVDSGTQTGVQWQSTGNITQQWKEIQQTQTGGSTDLQAVLTNTEQLLANWTQYTAVTLPSLNDILALIQQSVTATLQLAPGPVQASLGEIFSIVRPEFWQDRDLSGGTTCQRVDYDASFNALFGVTVVVDSYPAEWQFRTPDHAWGFHDLAVLTFVRGGQVTERHGIHTLTHTVSPLPQFPWPWQSAIPIALQPGDTHVTVDWAEGVCGHLVGHVLP